ncbi:putative homeodomain containing protein [Lyophyllum shimeji]|uniref:Homeodomain containing protein n=1 Tax=Lyophyllum shimeji TaxID=47721 RepID=A0A9P3PY22_LYOSH|nr:putative homeodomain containing protein [Lyophyllum shimeji]
MTSMPSLSRTSSTASVSSSDDAPGSNGATRRTRKRFTSDQLTMLENLFHQNSHPSREERDTVARLGGMETKSVTIWFQNKRQTERKVALNNTTNGGRTHTQPSSIHPTATTSRSSRPSLDRVASRSELPMPPPRTPTRQRDPNAAIWDNMPSSPIPVPFSPPLREYVEFGKKQRSTRTLEWACAAAQLSSRHGTRSLSRSRSRRGSRDKQREQEREKLDLTDDDTDEALTPPSTLGGGDVRWTTTPTGQITARKTGIDDDDMMKAALTLCGLGRRS